LVRSNGINPDWIFSTVGFPNGNLTFDPSCCSNRVFPRNPPSLLYGTDVPGSRPKGKAMPVQKLASTDEIMSQHCARETSC
jgi:hypothetical protein